MNCLDRWRISIIQIQVMHHQLTQNLLRQISIIGLTLRRNFKFHSLTICSFNFPDESDHTLDASSIYGSSDLESEELREDFGGLLKMTGVADSHLGILPLCSRARSVQIEMCTGCSECFYAGLKLTQYQNVVTFGSVWSNVEVITVTK